MNDARLLMVGLRRLGKMALVCLSGSGPLLPEVKKVPDFNS